MIRARARFAHRDGEDDFAARAFLQVMPLLFFGAEVPDVRRDDVIVQTELNSRCTCACELFDLDDGIKEIRSYAAVLFGQERA